MGLTSAAHVTCRSAAASDPLEPSRIASIRQPGCHHSMVSDDRWRPPLGVSRPLFRVTIPIRLAYLLAEQQISSGSEMTCAQTQHLPCLGLAAIDRQATFLTAIIETGADCHAQRRRCRDCHPHVCAIRDRC